MNVAVAFSKALTKLHPLAPGQHAIDTFFGLYLMAHQSKWHPHSLLITLQILSPQNCIVNPLKRLMAYFSIFENHIFSQTQLSLSHHLKQQISCNLPSSHLAL